MHSANTLFIIIGRLQEFIYKCLKEKNIFLRGGISNGYCNINNNFAFGNGLIEAYEVESVKAVYPRICLHESVSENKKLLGKLSLICKFIYGADSLLRFEDKLCYVDYLQYGICQSNISPHNSEFFDEQFLIHKNAIINKLSEIERKIKNSKTEAELLKNNRIKDKFVWLKGYHNDKVKGRVYELLI